MAKVPAVPLILVWVSLVLALCLQVMPLADGWQVYRPEWIGLMLIYWCMRTPDKVGVFHGFIIGILMDLIEGTALGQHALIFSLLAFMCALVYPRFRAYSLVQQSVLVLVLLGLVQLIEQWVRTLTGDFSIHLSFLIPSLISAVLWPWWSTMLKALERRLLGA
ncbi:MULTISPECIES: rod shape-determining protein MreD [Vreelandella]|uniref:Rod shape-determining protein MreD n=2 Tax=Vreelandella TaxID=3137766 RepID=A0A7C9P2R8_9GAMM|nr:MULTISPECIES: rod shape-determining protein MreD [Halomonas]NDL69590.1 rod shape-determining protein MreD [Halomonas alkaliphila]NYS43531.1 rod shape-determining protein MreD [Halomonas zhaodongensis]